MFCFPSVMPNISTRLVLKEPKTKTSVRKVFLPKTVTEMLVERVKDRCRQIIISSGAMIELINLCVIELGLKLYNIEIAEEDASLSGDVDELLKVMSELGDYYIKQIKCTQCGANELYLENGIMVCKYCNARFILKSEDIGINTADISIKSDVEELLKKCRLYPRNARRYAKLILDIDPDNDEALKYL